MNHLLNINNFILKNLNQGSDFYEFNIKHIVDAFETIPGDDKIWKMYDKMLKLGSDFSDTGCLANFLFATNDEKRIEFANDYSDFVLFRVDSREHNYFRIGVNRREISGDIGFPLHRDHQIHTLYNYLLGWVIYQNTSISQPLNETISNVKAKTIHLKGESNENFFGKMWHYVSLLHDVGYIFEGDLPGNNIDFNNERLTRGANWVHNYFLHHFWADAAIDYISIRKILYKYLDINAIDFDRINSMMALGDIITTLYNINEIKANVEKINPGFFKSEYQIMNFNYWDAFKIWEIFYDCFFSNSIQLERVRKLKKAYYEGMYKGNLSFGSRSIDHGVASGLLMLLSTSYFYSIYFNLQNLDSQAPMSDFKITELIKENWYNIFKQEGKYHLNPEKAFNDEMNVFERISDYILEYKFPHYDYYSEWFFTGLLWATSAAALHNIQEELPSKYFDEIRDGDSSGRLWIEDDPLAYLGILVDTIQSWDRFNVNRNPYFEKKVPFQSRDVFVKQEDNKLVFLFKDGKEIAESVQKDLNKALKDWDKYVSIESL